MEKIKELITLYQSDLAFNDFYPRLLNNIYKYPEYHFGSNKFLEGYRIKKEEAGFSENIKVLEGDIRIDVPVWFGNITSPERIVFIGLEPRHTRDDLNVEKIENIVYATPFAIEKNYSRYNQLFSEFIDTNNSFYLFTDVVKRYTVFSNVDKKANDINARKNFPSHAKNSFLNLQKELEIINPTKIICLGSLVHNFMFKNFSSIYQVKKITHPAAWGGLKKAKQELITEFSL